MKLSDYKGEDAIDLLADILEPMSRILSDNELKESFRGNAPKIDLVKKVLHDHKKEIIEILAITDGEDPSNYEVNVFTLPIKLMDLLDDEEFLKLFPSQSQNSGEESFGSATETTEGKEK